MLETGKSRLFLFLELIYSLKILSIIKNKACLAPGAML
jgi:hypothetical protein